MNCAWLNDLEQYERDQPETMAPTSTHPHSAVQCKLRKSVPQWLTEAVSNAVRNATECRVGIALVKRNGRAMLDEDTLVVMRLKDFESMCGEG